MDSLKCKNDFIVNTIFHGEPVEFLKDRGKIGNGGSSGNNTSCRILNQLEFVQRPMGGSTRMDVSWMYYPITTLLDDILSRQATTTKLGG